MTSGATTRSRCDADPCKTRKTGRIIDFALRFAPVFFNKVSRIRYLGVAFLCARTGVILPSCRGRNRSIRGRTGGSLRDADFVEFHGVFEHNNVAILTITITADIWVETPPRQAGQRHVPPARRGARPSAGREGRRAVSPGDYRSVSSRARRISSRRFSLSSNRTRSASRGCLAAMSRATGPASIGCAGSPPRRAATRRASG